MQKQKIKILSINCLIVFKFQIICNRLRMEKNPQAEYFYLQQTNFFPEYTLVLNSVPNSFYCRNMLVGLYKLMDLCFAFNLVTFID